MISALTRKKLFDVIKMIRNDSGIWHSEFGEINNCGSVREITIYFSCPNERNSLSERATSLLNERNSNQKWRAKGKIVESEVFEKCLRNSRKVF